MEDKQFKKIVRLTFEDRKVIQKLLNDGLSCRSISRILNRSNHCIGSEVRKNGGPEKYDATKAEELSEKNKNRQHTSNIRGIEYIKKLGPQVKKMLDDGKTFHEIRKESGISYITLLYVFKYLGVSSGNIFAVIKDLQDQIYNIQIQLEIIFEKIKEKIK